MTLGCGIFFVEEMQSLYESLFCHRTVDADGHRHDVAVLDQWRDIDRDLSFRHFGAPDDLVDGGLHRFRRRARGRRQQRYRRCRQRQRAGHLEKRSSRGVYSCVSSSSTSSETRSTSSICSRRQDRLVAKCGANAREALCLIIRRHDRFWVQMAGIDDAQPQLSSRGTVAGPRKVRGEIALEPLLRKRTAVAQQTEPDLPFDDDGASAFGDRPVVLSAIAVFRHRR